MDKINIKNKFSLINEHWSPKIVAGLNGQFLKFAKLKGEFVWHKHDVEDELFMVVKGRLKIAFKDKVVELKSGEMLVVPKGVEHKPIAENEVEVILFEPQSTVNTGEINCNLTEEKLEWI